MSRLWMLRLWTSRVDPGRLPGMPAGPSDATSEFGRRVRQRRHELGLSLEQAAARCSVHWTFLGQIERGRRNLTLHNILKISAGLEVQPGDLLNGIPAPD